MGSPVTRADRIEIAARRLIDALDGATESDGPRELRALRDTLSRAATGGAS